MLMRHSVLPEHIVDVLVSEPVPNGGQQLSAHHHSRSLLAIIPTSIRFQPCILVFSVLQRDGTTPKRRLRFNIEIKSTFFSELGFLTFFNDLNS